MRKKIYVLIISSFMAMSSIACGESAADTAISQTVSESDNNTEKVEETQESTEETKASADDSEESGVSMKDLEEYMLDKGVLSGEKTQVAASMIGAKDGIKYAASNAEIYEYDESSEEYKSLASGGSVEIEGMGGFSVSATSINGPFVLISSGDISQELIDAFDSYGK